MMTVVTSVPGKTAAGTSPVVTVAVIAPAIIVRAIVGAPPAVAAPVPVIPGIVPGPAAVPEGITPAPAIPGIIPPGVVPRIRVAPGRIPAVIVAGTPPGIVPGVVPPIVVYVDDITGGLGLVKPAEPCLIGFVIVKGIDIYFVTVDRLGTSHGPVANDSNASPVRTAVDAVVIGR
jgi:hypothetical protein